MNLDILCMPHKKAINFQKLSKGRQLLKQLEYKKLEENDKESHLFGFSNFPVARNNAEINKFQTK